MLSFASLDAAFERVHHDLSPIVGSGRPTKKPIKVQPTVAGFDIDPNADIWQYEPVGYQTFCEHKDHMHLLPKDWSPGQEGALSKRQFDDCVALLGDDPKTMFDPKIRKYTFGGFLWSKGSGKDFVCSIIQAYMTYVLLCMRNPQLFFGFPPGEPCDILNVGKKGQQAERVYFSKFRARMLGWSWLLDKYNIIDSGKRFSFKGKGLPYCEVGTRSVEFKDKIIRSFAENSGNPESLEGYNIIFYLCDEISGWVSEKERETAVKILNILRTSQGSRNTQSLAGIGMAISYPRQDDDIMFEIEKESQQPDSKVFFSRAYQWEIKPKRFYSGNTFKFNAGTEEQPDMFDIPVELDRDFFMKYPEKAKCVYLLKPPPVGGQFFDFIEKVDTVSYGDRAPMFKVGSEVVDSVDGDGKKVQYIRKKILGLNRAPQKGVDYVVWLDAAESTCDASLSVGHIEMITIIEGGERRETTAVVLDDTLVWEPDPDNRIIVDIGSMTRCVLDMRRYITIAAAWWDQWNSGTGMKDFRDAGIMCDKHNLNMDDYSFFKDLIYINRFIAPKSPTTDKGIGQLKHLSRTRTNVVPGSSRHKKDIADTWCGIVSLLMGPLIRKNLRVGHAPAAITIAGPASGKSPATSDGPSTTGTGAARANNPFSQPGSNSGGPQRVRDHSDMFRALSPALSGQGRVGGAPRNSSVKPAEPGKLKFPRGIRV